jgi:hypothetical protein
MARDRSELEQRRSQLAQLLPALSNNQANTYRRNCDALALNRAGVKHENPAELVRLAEAEVAADAAIRGVQRELRDLDAEIELMPRRRFGTRGWARRSPSAG